ncbi:MAG: cupin-like domain-containing protein [Steroidobacteraceae bacterium]
MAEAGPVQGRESQLRAVTPPVQNAVQSATAQNCEVSPIHGTLPLQNEIWTDMKSATVWDHVDAANFRNSIVPQGRPAVLKGVVAHWPAVRRAHESPVSFCSYLRQFMNARPTEVLVGIPAIRGRFAYEDDLRRFNFKREQLPLTVLMERLLQLRNEPDPPAMYAGATAIANYMPAFAVDHRLSLLEASTRALVSIWIGNQTRVSAHWDESQNIACAVGGRRRFTLFPIDQIGNLYFGPVDFTPAGQSISLVDFQNPDLAKYPRFEEALRHAEVAYLEPGDALYLPSLWIHHVESLDRIGVLVNYWWRDAARPYMVTPLLTMLHALLTIRDLSPPDRAAWKSVFDHYIFQGEGPAMAHVPAHARGAFASMTVANAERLSAYLAKTLQQTPPAS